MKGGLLHICILADGARRFTLTRGFVIVQSAKSTVSICHGERRPNEPAERESEDKSNHPDKISFAIPHQGVLPRHLL